MAEWRNPLMEAEAHKALLRKQAEWLRDQLPLAKALTKAPSVSSSPPKPR